MDLDSILDSSHTEERQSSSDPEMATQTHSNADRALYLDRLEVLYSKQLSEIAGFAGRESVRIDEVRKSIAQRHYKFLFDPLTATQETEGDSPAEKLANTLRAVSTALESLQAIAGHQSFLLVVNPYDEKDAGFLGGTILGREFWRGHRGCGAAGAQTFKIYCQTAAATQTQERTSSTQSYLSSTSSAHVPPPTTNPAKRETASGIKAEVYASVRNAIRSATGMRNAEMKWSNHDKLHGYGIRLEGWPPGVPKQNPSSLSTAQNKSILEALQNGTMVFIPLDAHTPGPTDGESLNAETTGGREEQDIFEGTIDFSGSSGGDEDVQMRMEDVPSSLMVTSPISRAVSTEQDTLPTSRVLPEAGRTSVNLEESTEAVTEASSVDARVRDITQADANARKRRRMDSQIDEKAARHPASLSSLRTQ